MRVAGLVFFFILSTFCWAQEAVFQGRIELTRDLASFETNRPTAGTLYLLTGAAEEIQVLSDEPFYAEVTFVEGAWEDEANLVSHQITLSFRGDVWKDVVVVKKPRSGAETLVYPYRKFQVAALADAQGFTAIAIPVFF